MIVHTLLNSAQFINSAPFKKKSDIPYYIVSDFLFSHSLLYSGKLLKKFDLELTVSGHFPP